LLQEPHPEELPAKGFSTPLIPNTENFFRTSSDPQAGQAMLWEPMTSFSKSWPQDPHLYS
jgi:hypothetical protein